MDNNFFNPDGQMPAETDYSAPVAAPEPESAPETYNSYQEFTPEPPKKKFRKTPVIIAAVAAVVIAGGAMTAIFNPVVKNYIRMATGSPEKYYQTIEKENFAEYSGSVSKQYAALLSDLSGSGDVNVKQSIGFTLNKAFADEMYLDLSEDLKINAEIDYIKAGNDYDMSLSGKLGSDDLGTLSAQLNTETLALYVLYSQLSESTVFVDLQQYLGDYMDDGMSSIIEGALDEATYSFGVDSEDLGLGSLDTATLDKLKDFKLDDYLTPEQLEDMLNRYYAIFVEGFNNVTLDKSVEATANGNSQKFNVATATLDIRDTKPIIIRILEELKNEDVIINILKKIDDNDINEYSYRGAIEIVIGQVNSKFDEYIEDNFDLESGQTVTFELKTYIDNVGKIQGREITVNQTSDGYYENQTFTFSSITTKNGNDCYYEAKAHMNQTYTQAALDDSRYNKNQDYDLFEASGIYTESGSIVSGNFDIIVVQENVDYDDEADDTILHYEKLAFTLDLQGYGTEEHDGKLYEVGDITFTVPSYTVDKLNASNYSEIPGEIKVSLHAAYDNGPAYGLKLDIAGKQYFDVNFAAKYGAATASQLDKDSALSPEEWMMTANQEWILKLSEIFGNYFNFSSPYSDYTNNYGDEDEYWDDFNQSGGSDTAFDGIYPMDASPVSFDGSVCETETLGITLNLPEDWTNSEYDQTLTIQSSNMDEYLMLNNNSDFPYSSSKEIEKEFYDVSSVPDAINTKATDYYVINNEECIRVDIINSEFYTVKQSIIYIPSKNLTVFASGEDWETLNAVIQTIKQEL